MGEALRLEECQRIDRYTVYWDRRVNDTCYHQFPVKTPLLGELRFLNIQDRKLVREGLKRPCTTTPMETYIKDGTNSIWHMKNNTFTKMKKINWRTNSDHIGLMKIGHFHSQLLHYQSPLPQRLSMLYMLHRSRDIFDQLNSFKETGGGSILAGIGSLLGQTISSLASGGSQIIRALGAGIRDTFHGVGDLDESVVGLISNATANVITAGTTGVSKVLEAIGGPSGIILYILVIILYVYTIYNRVKDKAPLTMNLGFGNNSSKKQGLDNPHLVNEEDFAEEDTKHVETNNRVFRPVTRSSGLNTKAIWNPRGQVNPASL